MAEEKKNTGMCHDDDGNVDDRRIAGWIVTLVCMYVAIAGLHMENPKSVEILQILIWPAVALMGATIAEKFKKR